MTIRSQDTGFTLMELLIVLAIAGLLVSLSEPLYSAAVPGARAKSEARGLIVALRDAANRAVSSGRETRVSFSPQESQYSVGDRQPVGLSDGTRIVVTTYAEETHHDDTRGDEGNVLLRFFPDGSSSGATILLKNAAREYLIGVDWLTGRIEVLEKAPDAT